MTIAEGVFHGCTSLESIKIPGGVTTIEEYALKDCSSLDSIVIPDGVVIIGDYVFLLLSIIEIHSNS